MAVLNVANGTFNAGVPAGGQTLAPTRIKIYEENFFFDIGLKMNLMIAFCSWLPLPQQDGLSLFFGSKGLWMLAVLAILAAAVLLLTKTTIGLIVIIVVGTIIGITTILTGSEK